MDATGLKKSPEKEKTILQVPPPGKISQLFSFLGVLYYGKFLPNLATVLLLLHAKEMEVN